MKFYQLHAADDRPAAFANLSPPVWLENDFLRTWVVADPDLALKILRSPLAVIASRAGILKTLSDRYGIELPNAAYACRVLPVLAEDDAHPAVRKGFATFLAGRLSALDPHLGELARKALAPLGRKGRLELLSDIVEPFIVNVFSVLLQRDVPQEILSLGIADIVFFNTTVSRMRALDSRVAKALSFLRAGNDSEDEVAWKFTCLVFGLDSLSAMLTESLVAALRGPYGTKLPDHPVETGVPVTFRSAETDFEMNGHHFKKGDLIRLQLQSFGYSERTEDRKFIFGAGMHSCVGRQLTLRIWEQFRQAYNGLDIQTRIVERELVPSHYLILYKSVQVEVF